MPTHCIEIPKSRVNNMTTKEDPAVLLEEYDHLLDRIRDDELTPPDGSLSKPYGFHSQAPTARCAAAWRFQVPIMRASKDSVNSTATN